jgi:hypothetical protein
VTHQNIVPGTPLNGPTMSDVIQLDVLRRTFPIAAVADNPKRILDQDREVTRLIVFSRINIDLGCIGRSIWQKSPQALLSA